MIGLDTNVLIRFLVEDDPRQAARVKQRFQTAIARRTPLYVPDIVLCETVWVLEDSYAFARGAISDTLEKLLAAGNLRFENAERAERALAAFRAGKGDFADYVIAEQAIAAGCETVLTFDKALLREPRFEAP